jgi:hypothetical protein
LGARREGAQSGGRGSGEGRAPGLPNFAVWGFAAPRFALRSREFGPPPPPVPPRLPLSPASATESGWSPRARIGQAEEGATLDVGEAPPRCSPHPHSHTHIAGPGWQAGLGKAPPPHHMHKPGAGWGRRSRGAPTHRRWQGSKGAPHGSPKPCWGGSGETPKCVPPSLITPAPYIHYRGPRHPPPTHRAGGGRRSPDSPSQPSLTDPALGDETPRGSSPNSGGELSSPPRSAPQSQTRADALRSFLVLLSTRSYRRCG